MKEKFEDLKMKRRFEAVLLTRIFKSSDHYIFKSFNPTNGMTTLIYLR